MALTLEGVAILEIAEMDVLPHGSQETSIARSLVDLLPPRRAKARKCLKASYFASPSFGILPLAQSVALAKLHPRPWGIPNLGLLIYLL